MFAIFKKRNRNPTLQHSIGKRIDLSFFPFIILSIFVMRGIESETYIVFLLIIGWIAIASLSDFSSFLWAFLHKSMILVLMYFLYVITISLLFEGLITTVGFILNQLSFFIFILMFNYYYKKYNYKGIKNIAFFVITIWIYYSIKALIFYNNNPLLARQIVSSSESPYESIAIGGAYGLAFGSAILGVYLFGTLFSARAISNVKKIVLTVLFLACILITIETGSTITLISLLVGLILNTILLFIGKKDKKEKILRYIPVTILCTLMLFNLRGLGVVLIDFSTAFSSPLLSSRLEQLGTKISTGLSTGTLEARESLYNLSINTFLDNPVIGTSSLFGLRMNPLVGGHSEILDNLAKLGLLGFIFIALIFFYTIKIERKRNKDYIVGGYVVTLLLMMMLNPFNYPQAYFVLFFIIPMLGLLIKSNVENNFDCKEDVKN